MAKQDEGENLAVLASCQLLSYFEHLVSLSHLLPAAKEKSQWVHAVGDSAANKWEPMKDHRRFVSLVEQQLIDDIERDGDDKPGQRPAYELEKRYRTHGVDVGLQMMLEQGSKSIYEGMGGKACQAISGIVRVRGIREWVVPMAMFFP